MAARLLKLACIYFMTGITLGLVMGMTQQFQFHSVHAHINLLGWASLALAGIVFHLFPELGETRLASIFFWLYNVALPVGLSGLALTAAGYAWADPILGIGFTFVWLAGCVFCINVLVHLRRTPRTVAA